MQLDKLIIETRVRSGWSSIDLGFSLARRFWLRSVILYLMIAMPVFGLTILFDTSSNFWLSTFIFWWLKPFFELPILHMMSRELFSQPMGVKQVLKDFFLWFKPSFFWLLLWRRFSIYRGMSGPIMLLEQPKSSEYSKRASVLVSKFSSSAMWLNIVLYHMETFIFFAILAFIGLFFPEIISVIFSDAYLEPQSGIYIDVLFLISFTVVAPFFTAAGFMLYISRRIELEGWDIEIVFRNWMAGFRAPIRDEQFGGLDISKQGSVEAES